MKCSVGISNFLEEISGFSHSIVFLYFFALINAKFSSLQSLIRVWLFATPWTAARQASQSIINSWSLLKLMAIRHMMPFNHFLPCCPLFLPPSIFPSIRVFSNQSVLCISGQSIGVSASASVLPMNIQGWFPLWLTGLICSPRDSQKSSPTPQFKSIISLALSFISSPTVTSIHDYWESHSFDYTGICWQSLCFLIVVQACHSFSSKQQVSFNFRAAVTIRSDFGAQENKVCRYFHCLPIYLPLSDGTRCHDLSFLNVEF